MSAALYSVVSVISVVELGVCGAHPAGETLLRRDERVWAGDPDQS